MRKFFLISLIAMLCSSVGLSDFVVLSAAKDLDPSLRSGRQANSDRLKAFTCQSRHSLFDPGFEQGSEVYLDVFFYPSSHKAEIALWPANSPRFNLYPAESNTSAVYFNQSSVTMTWKTSGWETYVSMQYLGGPWGFATKVPTEYEDSQFAGEEYEIWCEETEHTNIFLNMIEK